MLIQLPSNTSSIEITPLATHSGVTIRITLRDDRKPLPIRLPAVTGHESLRRRWLRPVPQTLLIVGLALGAALAGHVMSSPLASGAVHAVPPGMESPDTHQPPVQRHVVQTGPATPDAFGLN